MALEELTSGDKLNLGNKSLRLYQMLMQHVARDNLGLSLARRENVTFFLRMRCSAFEIRKRST